jgi:phage-related protein
MEEARMEDIIEKVKQHTADAGKKFQDVLGNVGPSIDELLRKVLSREAAKPRKRKVLVGFAAAQPTLFMVSGCPEGT